MALTISFTDTLVVLTCWCGINHAVPQDLREYQLRQHDNGKADVIGIYCPLGHTHVPSGEGKAARLQREKEQAEATAARRLAQLDQERASHSATKGQLTKARKRAAAAVCPVPGCKRRIVQMERHLQTKHPDYDPVDHDHTT